MSKKIFLAATALCVLYGAAAFAADINVRLGEPVYVAPAPVYVAPRYYPTTYDSYHRDRDWQYWEQRRQMEARERWEREHRGGDRHDNGKHKGWSKNHHEGRPD